MSRVLLKKLRAVRARIVLQHGQICSTHCYIETGCRNHLGSSQMCRESVAGGKSTEAWCSVLSPARDLGVSVNYHRPRHLYGFEIKYRGNVSKIWVDSSETFLPIVVKVLGLLSSKFRSHVVNYTSQRHLLYFKLLECSDVALCGMLSLK